MRMWDKGESGQGAEWQGHVPGGRKGREESRGGGGSSWMGNEDDGDEQETDRHFLLPAPRHLHPIPSPVAKAS